MNLNNLTPEQLKLIVDLSKRIETLETRLGRLQGKVIRIDRRITTELAAQLDRLHLN